MRSFAFVVSSLMIAFSLQTEAYTVEVSNENPVNGEAIFQGYCRMGGQWTVRFGGGEVKWQGPASSGSEWGGNSSYFSVYASKACGE